MYKVFPLLYTKIILTLAARHLGLVQRLHFLNRKNFLLGTVYVSLCILTFMILK